MGSGCLLLVFRSPRGVREAGEGGASWSGGDISTSTTTWEEGGLLSGRLSLRNGVVDGLEVKVEGLATVFDRAVIAGEFKREAGMFETEDAMSLIAKGRGEEDRIAVTGSMWLLAQGA